MAKAPDDPKSIHDLTRAELIYLLADRPLLYSRSDLLWARSKALHAKADALIAQWTEQEAKVEKLRKEAEEARAALLATDVLAPSYMKRRSLVARLDADVRAAEAVSDGLYRARERLWEQADGASSRALKLMEVRHG